MTDRPAETRGAPERTAPAAARVQYAIVPVPRLSLETVARRSGLHPDLIRRFVALGLVDAERDAAVTRRVLGTAAPPGQGGQPRLDHAAQRRVLPGHHRHVRRNREAELGRGGDPPSTRRR